MITMLEFVFYAIILTCLIILIGAIVAFVMYQINEYLLKTTCDRIEKERFHRETKVKWHALENAYRKLQAEKAKNRQISDILERTFKLRETVKQELEQDVGYSEDEEDQEIEFEDM